MNNVSRAFLLVVLPCLLLFIPQFVGAQDATIWSADIDVSDYSGGSLIATSFSNVTGTEAVTPTLLWYAASVNQMRITFRTAPNWEGLTLHLGDLALPVSDSELSGNRWVWRNVDPPDWAGRETFQVRLVKEFTPTPEATDIPVRTATDTPVPTATKTPVPTATDTPVPTVTKTPVPTATSTPVSTATNTPVPTALEIVGSDAFIRRIQQDLDEIERRSQYWYDFVNTYLNRVVLSTNAIGAGHVNLYSATFYVYPEPFILIRPHEHLIGSLVHEACHVYRWRSGLSGVWWDSLIEETVCVIMQRDAIQDMFPTGKEYYIDNQNALLSNIHRPECQWWRPETNGWALDANRCYEFSTEPATATNTPTPTDTSTVVSLATNTPTATATETPVASASDTPVPTGTDTPTASGIATPLPTATVTPVLTASDTPTPTATDTPLPSASDTPVQTTSDKPTLPFDVRLNGTACHLADAIAAANSDTATGYCPAGSGADTITLTRNITLGAALPSISSDVTIEGGSHSISGNNAHRIFSAVTGSNLTIQQLSMNSGNAASGGAIYNIRGLITVSNSTFSSNTAEDKGGAIYSYDGSVSIHGSGFRYNEAEGNDGGAIYNYDYRGLGQLTIVYSTFSHNSARVDGGAIDNQSGKLVISGSTFSSNTATWDGGAIENNGRATITNSTFYSNLAHFDHGGAIHNTGGTLTITNSTIYSNRSNSPGPQNSKGGGIHKVGGTVNLRNSIIAGSTSGRDCYGGLDQNVNNLIQDDTCSPTLSGNPMLGDRTGSPAYYTLLENSPAINAAHTNHCPATDQAGNTRPRGAACDIGAYESAISAATETPTPTDTLTETPTPTDTPSPTATPTLTLTPTVEPDPWTCAQAGAGEYWLFLEDNFLNGLVTVYPGDTCEVLEIIQTDIGEDGYVYTADGPSDAVDRCGAAHDDGVTYSSEQHDFNDNIWKCVPPATETPTPTATLTNTPIPPTPTPTATETNSPMATETATMTASPTVTNTPEPPERCKTLMEGFTFLFPKSYFLSATADVYSDSHCQNVNPSGIAIPGDGMVYTTQGEAAAEALCKAGVNDGAEYTVERSVINSAFWSCNRVPSTPTPTATNTATAVSAVVPSATNTAVPTATDTAIPPTDNRAVYGLDAVSNRAGELTVLWNAPSETPADYRVSWARASESYKTWTDLTGNAFPTDPSYTVTGLDHGTLYKVQVRARYSGSSGPWTDSVEALVMDSTTQQIQQVQEEQEVILAPSDTATATAVPPTATPTPTNTPAPPTATPSPTNTTVPPTAVPTSTNTAVPPTATNTPVPTATYTPEPAGRTISNVRLSSSQAGVLEVSWDAPGETPKDYRVAWAPVDGNFKTWTDLSGNAFPTSNSYNITGLDAGARYKVQVRARYHSGGPGDWHDVVEGDVAAG